MTTHLLSIGAPVDWFGYYENNTPLFDACCRGSEGVVRQLLQHHSTIMDSEMQEAARRGHLGIVSLLIDHGADVNRGDPIPIVSAARLEYTEMFHLLLRHGAVLTGEVMVEAERVTRKEGLESMVELLGEYSKWQVISERV